MMFAENWGFVCEKKEKDSLGQDHPCHLQNVVLAPTLNTYIGCPIYVESYMTAKLLTVTCSNNVI